MSLKQTLFDYDLVSDCEALDKYIALLEANRATEQTKYTQAHHAIPVIYYTRLYDCEARSSSRCRRLADSKANEDPNNFSVNLSYADHLLAHAYLAICGKPDWFIFSNGNVLNFAKINLTPEELVALKNTEAFNEGYAKYIDQRKKRKMSAEQKAKIAEAHRRENMSEEYHQKLSAANRKRIWKEESKAKIAESNRNRTFKLSEYSKAHPSTVGTVWVTNGKEAIRIKPEEYQEYISKGYVRGRKLEHKSNRRRYITNV